MSEQFSKLDPKHIEFIQNQRLFFVGTARSDGRVNISPKGIDSLRILNPRKLVWLNLTGSGNETAAHIIEANRMTLMFCSFDKQPLILRLYGRAKAIHPRDEQWRQHKGFFLDTAGARQFFLMDLTMVQTSCGYGVPFFEFQGERHTLQNWAEKKGRDGIREYWKEKNQVSIDGFETNILD